MLFLSACPTYQKMKSTNPFLLSTFASHLKEFRKPTLHLTYLAFLISVLEVLALLH